MFQSALEFSTRDTFCSGSNSNNFVEFIVR